MNPIPANNISANTSNAVSNCLPANCNAKDSVAPWPELASPEVLQKMSMNSPQAKAASSLFHTINNGAVQQKKEAPFTPVQTSLSNKKQKPVLQGKSGIAATRPALSLPVQRNELEQKDGGESQFISDTEFPGKLQKNLFLQTLKGQVYEVANQVLAQINQTAAQCPYINKWFLYYSGRNAAQIAAAIERFAPETAAAQSVEAYITAICTRIQAGLENHVKTGSIDDVPDEIVEKEHKPLDFVHIATNPTAQLACLCGESDLDKAVANFDRFKVINMTNIAFQLVAKEDDQEKKFNDRDNVWRGRTRGHVVNKWERYADGERDYGGEEHYGGDKNQTKSTNDAEAGQMGKDPAEYLELAPHKKMQFALLDFKDNPRGYSPGWGRSYFEIKKTKANSSGYLHFGDSLYNMFNSGKGKYSDFAQKLRANKELAKKFADPKKQIDDNWIEVNIADGISLPGDVDKLVVHPGELDYAVGIHDAIIPGDDPAAKKETFKQALTNEFGANVEYK